jgi:hypothetical protein
MLMVLDPGARRLSRLSSDARRYDLRSDAGLAHR